MTQSLRAFQRQLSMHTIVCALTLCTFGVTSLGLPYATIGQATSGCRCGEDLRAAGRCCCVNKVRAIGEEPPRAACCAARSKAKSCCQAPQTAPRDADGTQKSPLVTACHCGGSTSLVILINAEARVLPVSRGIYGLFDVVERITSNNPSVPFRSIAPETPPPKVRYV